MVIAGNYNSVHANAARYSKFASRKPFVNATIKLQEMMQSIVTQTLAQGHVIVDIILIVQAC